MLSDSLGTAQHLSPGEALAEKSKVEHWHCFAVSWGQRTWVMPEHIHQRGATAERHCAPLNPAVPAQERLT